MTKKDDPNKGFKIGDLVEHRGSGVKGLIENFEWSGKRRALIKKTNSPGWYVRDLDELIKLESTPTEPEPQLKQEPTKELEITKKE
jgi:hypothetical protein